ncbi:MAG: Transcriptional regulator of nonfermentable carbon utilization [Bogoriella megaspora]|nr:MAG: Transcriptional regulator of nonfermentable carbon utilization [Bogoriella megaspora]
MSPDAEDASPASSSDQNGDQETGTMAEQQEARASSEESPKAQPSNGQKPTSNAKDPSRPRRKKARRACFACQRAHLTCGDERPCQRCIKRGLQDACQDGVRKKAKYLHDAPDGALMPGIGGRYPHANGRNGSAPGATPVTPGPLNPQAQYFPQAQAGAYPMFTQSTDAQSIPPSLQDIQMINQFNAQQSPISPHFSSNPSQQTSPLQGLNDGSQTSPQYPEALFDPSDPALFNFDLASLNFGNHYGALEFGMLGHMSSAVDTPQGDGSMMQNVNQPHSTSGSYSGTSASGQRYQDGSGQRPDYAYVQDATMSDWQNQNDASQSNGMIYNPAAGPGHGLVRNNSHNNGLPHAFAIGAGPSSHAGESPASTGQDTMMYDASNPMSPSMFVNSPTQQQNMYNRQSQQQAHHPAQPVQQPNPTHEKHVTLPKNMRLPTATALSNPRKRDRDPSSIYNSVTAPYAYTASFHGLISVLLRRLPKSKVMRIAESMSQFRPTFIACTRTLGRQDLIFMEQGFQRMLWEYEDFINAYGTPSIICRRTGEVVGVNKEFCLLTGWSRDVLLGNEKNKNINYFRGDDGSSSGAAGSGTASSHGGFNTPKGASNGNNPPNPPSAGGDSGNGNTMDGGAVSNGDAKHQPVYIAELLDDDSIIRFYEDFSMLAFGDSRGSVMNPCSLLKYRTEEDLRDDEAGGSSPTANDLKQRNGSASGKGNRSAPIKLEHSIHNEAGMHALGKREGKVDCMYCWTTRRDVFDMPMLIVMNFLPKI